MKFATLRRQLEEIRRNAESNERAARQNAWKNMYYNEVCAMMEKHGLRNPNSSIPPSSYIVGTAPEGCESIMRFIADMENNGWEFDYDLLKYDGGHYIDARIVKPLTINLNFYIGDSHVCSVVEEESYEMQKVVKRKIVCN